MTNANSLSIQLNSGQLQVLDPHNLLKECLVFFAFPKSRSANFPIALSLAQAAPAYGEQSIGGRMLYWAGYSSSTSDLKKAAELIRLAGNWVGTLVQISGCRITQPFNAYLTIACHLEGIQCASQAAHCHKLIDDPFHPNYDSFSQTIRQQTVTPQKNSTTVVFQEEIKQYIFPCKRMLQLSLAHPQFSFQSKLIATPTEQIQAAAVAYGISICPSFDATAFSEIGAKKMIAEEPIVLHKELPNQS